MSISIYESDDSVFTDSDQLFFSNPPAPSSLKEEIEKIAHTISQIQRPSDASDASGATSGATSSAMSDCQHSWDSERLMCMLLDALESVNSTDIATFSPNTTFRLLGVATTLDKMYRKHYEKQDPVQKRERTMDRESMGCN
jgi:hypothetical protein